MEQLDLSTEMPIQPMPHMLHDEPHLHQQANRIEGVPGASAAAPTKSDLLQRQNANYTAAHRGDSIVVAMKG